MKLLLYVAIGLAALVVAALVITGGQASASQPLILLPFVALFAIPPAGAFWMMYLSIRYEKKPLPLLLLAIFIPFSFVWYYFQRVRPRKLKRTREFA